MFSRNILLDYTICSFHQVCSQDFCFSNPELLGEALGARLVGGLNFGSLVANFKSSLSFFFCFFFLLGFILDNFSSFVFVLQ